MRLLIPDGGKRAINSSALWRVQLHLVRFRLVRVKYKLRKECFNRLILFSIGSACRTSAISLLCSQRKKQTLLLLILFGYCVFQADNLSTNGSQFDNASIVANQLHSSMTSARVAELADALDLGSSAHRAWGFESPLSYSIIAGVYAKSA